MTVEIDGVRFAIDREHAERLWRTRRGGPKFLLACTTCREVCTERSDDRPAAYCRCCIVFDAIIRNPAASGRSGRANAAEIIGDHRTRGPLELVLRTAREAA